MDRRSKIIVSVVSIFLVLLALIGITYAYFLTRIEGNTNDTSVSITTANLRIVYADASPNIEVSNIQPSKTNFYTKSFTVTNEGNEVVDYEVYLENVINNFVNEEDLLMFVTCSSNIDGNTCNGYGSGSVSNNTPTFGTSTYPTVNSKLIENTIEPAGDGVEKEVHTYTLYLRFLDDDSDQSDDMDKELQGKIQIYDPKDIISISGMLTGYEDGYYVQLQSEIKTSELKYEKTVDGVKYYSYIFHGVKPESDAHTLSIMKRGSATPIVQKSITVTKGTNASVNTDASSIVIDDDTLNIEMNIALTKSGETTSIETTAGEIVKIQKTFSEKILSDNNVLDGNDIVYDTDIVAGLYSTNEYTQDNGTTYFYRGNVSNNYVDFAGSIWRIIRINEDGSVRVIYHGDEDGIKSSNPTSIGEGIYDSEVANYNSLASILNTWFENNLSDVSSNLIDAGFCNDMENTGNMSVGEGEVYYYRAYRRFENIPPKFACSDSSYLFTTSTSAIGNKQATYPIGIITADESMYAGNYKNNNTTYLTNYYDGLTLSPYIYEVGDTTGDGSNVITIQNALITQLGDGGQRGDIYPVINIDGDLIAEGNGTTESPYQIIVE